VPADGEYTIEIVPYFRKYRLYVRADVVRTRKDDRNGREHDVKRTFNRRVRRMVRLLWWSVRPGMGEA
jgi:aminoglycoside phosphotransferase family enzyme